MPADRSGRGKTLRAAIINVVPQRAIAAAMCRLYPRVEPELARLHQFLPRGGTALDVGAWYGPWTRRMAKTADRVVSIEAHPELAELLRHVAPNVDVRHAAASDQSGQIALSVPSGGAALGLSSVEDTGSGELVMVPRIAIDDLGLDGVTFIKMDVEGHEYAALRGAAATIARHRPLILVELEERLQDVVRVVDLLAFVGLHRLRPAEPHLASAGRVRSGQPPAGCHPAGGPELRTPSTVEQAAVRQHGALPTRPRSRMTGSNLA